MKSSGVPEEKTRLAQTFVGGRVRRGPPGLRAVDYSSTSMKIFHYFIYESGTLVYGSE